MSVCVRNIYITTRMEEKAVDDIFSYVNQVYHAVVEYAVRRPLWNLYRNGPELVLFSIGRNTGSGITASFGFWKGATDEEICYQLTGVVPAHWAMSDSAQAECNNMIQRHYEAFFTGVVAAMYLSFFYKCSKWILA